MSPPPKNQVPLDAQSGACQSYMRRYSHDLGNCLSAIDLQTMVLQRSAGMAEEGPRLAIVRKQVACIVEMQLRLGLRFRTPPATAVTLSACVEQCRSRPRIASAEIEIVWSFDGTEAWLHAAPEAISVLVVEIADHWFAHGGGTIKVSASDGCACFQMQHTDDAERDQPLMEVGVQEELAALLARLGGVWVGVVSGTILTVTLPLTLAGASC